MKTATEYQTRTLLRADNLKRTSTTLKRTAGGVHSVIAASDFHGLSEKEVKILAEAASLLNTLSANMAKASKLKKTNEDQFERRLTQAKKGLAENFAKLTSPRELVPMIAMTTSAFWLKTPLGESASTVALNLPRGRQEALDDIAYHAAKSEGDLDTAIQQAWGKFQTLQPSLEAKHRYLIAALEEILK